LTTVPLRPIVWLLVLACAAQGLQSIGIVLVVNHGFRSVFRRFLVVGNGATVIARVDPSRTSSNRQTWQRYTRFRSGMSPSWRICVWHAGHFHGGIDALRDERSPSRGR
jgi:hypothetical protein